MKRRTAIWSACVLTCGLGFADLAGAGPISETFNVGDGISGSFVFDLSQTYTFAGDFEQAEYTFAGPSSFLNFSIGGFTFASIPTGGVTVSVTNGMTAGNDDFIGLRARGSDTSFAPFLTGFDAQDPNISAIGNSLLNFHFPGTYLSSSVLPTMIDPGATVGIQPGSSFPNIYGQIEGVSVCGSARARQWQISYEVNPANVTSAAGIVSGSFSGSITGIDDATNTWQRPCSIPANPVAVPEPATLVLLGIGLLGVAIARRRNTRKSF